jgi:hypothetical protein
VSHCGIIDAEQQIEFLFQSSNSKEGIRLHRFHAEEEFDSSGKRAILGPSVVITGLRLTIKTCAGSGR